VGAPPRLTFSMDAPHCSFSVGHRWTESRVTKLRAIMKPQASSMQNRNISVLTRRRAALHAGGKKHTPGPSQGRRCEKPYRKSRGISLIRTRWPVRGLPGTLTCARDFPLLVLDGRCRNEGTFAFRGTHRTTKRVAGGRSRCFSTALPRGGPTHHSSRSTTQSRRSDLVLSGARSQDRRYRLPGAVVNDVREEAGERYPLL
jgi:hypothetical protein